MLRNYRCKIVIISRNEVAITIVVIFLVIFSYTQFIIRHVTVFCYDVTLSLLIKIKSCSRIFIQRAYKLREGEPRFVRLLCTMKRFLRIVFGFVCFVILEPIVPVANKENISDNVSDTLIKILNSWKVSFCVLFLVEN